MKNHYTLNPGEFFVAQELVRRRKDLEIYHPLEDIGCDLLAVSRKNSHKPVRIQVKESRTYANGNSWHQVRKGKLRDADVFVFVSYVTWFHGACPDFEIDYVVIPSDELKRLCDRKTASGGKYSFYFRKEGRQVFEHRDKKRLDVTRFHRAWDLI